MHFLEIAACRHFLILILILTWSDKFCRQMVPWKHTFASGLGLCELITFSLSIITFSLSRTTGEVSHVAAGEHMVPGPFIFGYQDQREWLLTFGLEIVILHGVSSIKSLAGVNIMVAPTYACSDLPEIFLWGDAQNSKMAARWTSSILAPTRKHNSASLFWAESKLFAD
jgi:hypothetical protein